MTDTIRRADALPPPDIKPILPGPTDPEEVARLKQVLAAGGRNYQWLAAHWDDLLPACLGKYVAVANETPFLADTIEEALAWAKSQQPHDPGYALKYVPPVLRPTVYAH